MNHSAVDFLSPVSVTAVAVLAILIAAGYLLARFTSGPPAEVARRWGVFALRGLVVAALAAILWNPVRIDRSPGPMERPEVFYLLDASESMGMGNSATRWQEAVAVIEEAEQTLSGDTPAELSRFRFGQRLAAIQPNETERGSTSERGRPGDSDVSPSPPRPLAPSQLLSEAHPDDADTRLVPALRRLTSRFGRTPPASIVIFSDGRARNPDGVRTMARHFGNLDVPIHTVPVGETARGGDVAIAGVVAPQRVRKYTEVSLQVFLRSFGYDGARTSLELWALADDDSPPRKLQSLPVTLSGGVQSRALTFRSDLDTRRLRVRVVPRSDEVSTTNNEFTTEITIDRTKIRVLYVEGNSRRLYRVRRGDEYEYRGPHTDLREALTQDEDIECVVVTRAALAGLRNLSTSSGTVRNFPKSRAELFAYDALVLSDVRPDPFTDEQLGWIEQWVGRRGGGLCMTGGSSSFAAGGWDQTPLADVLPVRMRSKSSDWAGARVAVAPAPSSLDHPLWRIVDNAARNREVVRSLPAFSGANRLAGAKPDLTTVLATTERQATSGGLFSRLFGTRAGATEPGARETAPAIVVGRFGNGRTLAMATPITVPGATEFVNEWGNGDNRYYGKFWRNAVYWLTEGSFVGRRRLVVSTDKRFYRPGETLTLRATAYDEAASRTGDYRVVTMIEPKGSLADLQSAYAPIHWPEHLPRDSQFGGEGPYIAWGEEFELPRVERDSGRPGYEMTLNIADPERFSSAGRGLRVELTAYEGYTQVDSTSQEIQILHDPFEQRNPFPDHELLSDVATLSGGRVLQNGAALVDVIQGLPVKRGEPLLSRVPLWSRWWLFGLLLLLLTAEWIWRRSVGMA